jgi:crotonobetaine/carnitine-CoA ligase
MLNHHFEISFAIIYNKIVALKENDISLNFLPFFHIAGKFMLLGALLTGSRMILQQRFSIENFWNDIRTHDVTVTVGVGGICHMLFAAESRSNDSKNPLRMIYAVPNPHDVQEKFKERFNVELTEGYGSTEANIVIYSRPNEKTPKGSCGRVAAEYDVKIVDPDGNECPPGVSGEFVVRPKFPNTLMSGYYGIPEKSMEVFRDLWFHSGDRGMKDSKGYFYFLDRMKDAIRRRGENISSFEVERIINMHTDVAESAAIAVPAKVGEDEVKVIVVLNKGVELSPLSLLKYCVKAMPYFMVPRFIEFKKTLPRTPTQKVRKIELRKQGITRETWDCHQAGVRVTRQGLKDIC